VLVEVQIKSGVGHTNEVNVGSATHDSPRAPPSRAVLEEHPGLLTKARTPKLGRRLPDRLSDGLACGLKEVDADRILTAFTDATDPGRRRIRNEVSDGKSHEAATVARGDRTSARACA
jgi:hypothetical protein